MGGDAGYDAGPLECDDFLIENDRGQCAPSASDFDIALWLDATRESSVTLTDATDLVEAWGDWRTGLGATYELTGNGDGRPALVDSGIADLPSLDFDGDDSLLGPALSALNGVDYTVFVVAGELGAGDRRLLTAINGNDGFTLKHLVDGSRASFEHRWTGSDAVSAVIVGMDADAKVLVAERRGGEAPRVRLTGSTSSALDGATAEKTDVTEPFDVDPSVLLGGATGVDGLVSEVLLFKRALADAELEAVRQYLADKWELNP
jgi:hypothetical protein